MIRKEKVYPVLSFEGEDFVHDSLYHEFRDDGTVLLSDRHGNELSLDLAGLAPHADISLSEDGETVIYRLTRQAGLGANKTDIAVEFDFAALRDRVKVRIHGEIPNAATLQVPVTALHGDIPTGKEANKRRRVEAAKYDALGEIESSVAFDFSDMECEYRNGKLLIEAAEAFDLDPSTVGTSTQSSACWYTYQRKTFNHAGRFWVFYTDGTNGVYRTRVIDPLGAWSGSTTWQAGIDRGYMFALFWDGAYIHVVFCTGTSSALRYRRGTPFEDGTITWEAVRTIRGGVAGHNYFYGDITVDSAGYPAVIYSRYPAAGYYRVVEQRATATDGSAWTAANEFESHATAHVYVSSIHAMLDRRLMLFWHNAGLGVQRYMWWNGAAWSAKQNLPAGMHGRYNPITVGDRIMVNASVGGKACIYWWEDDVWSAPEEICDGNMRCLSQVQNVIIGIVNDAGAFYSVTYTGTWGARVFLCNHSVSNAVSIGSTQIVGEGRVGIIWTEGAVSPWTVKHYYFTVTAVVTTVAPESSRYACRLNGSVNDNYGDIIDYVGFVWDTVSRALPANIHPSATDYSDYWLSDEGNYGICDFNHLITTVPLTLYYVRAVVHLRNADFWAYGDELNFYSQKIRIVPDTTMAQWAYGLYFATNPSAIYFEGTNHKRTFVGWQDYAPNGYKGGVGCDPYLSYYDHDTRTWHGPWKIEDTPAGTKGDPHSGATLMIDSNNRLHVFYGSHATDTPGQYWVRSTRDIDSADPFTGAGDWEAPICIAGGTTYPQLLIDSVGVAWLVNRRSSAAGPNTLVSYRTSNNYDGPWAAASFSAQTDITTNWGEYLYPTILPRLDNAGNIHIAWNRNPGTDNFDLYYIQWNFLNARFEQADGTPVAIPINRADADAQLRIVAGSVQVHSEGIAVNETGMIFIAYRDVAATKIRLIRWNGVAWDAPIEIGDGSRYTMQRLRGILYIYVTHGGELRQYLSRDDAATWEGPYTCGTFSVGQLCSSFDAPDPTCLTTELLVTGSDSYRHRGQIVAWGMNPGVSFADTGNWRPKEHVRYYDQGAGLFREAVSVRRWNATAAEWEILWERVP